MKIPTWLLLVALIAAVIVVGPQPMGAPEQQAIFTGRSISTVPWWAMLGIIFLPGIAAVLLTNITVIIWKRVWRADGNPPPKPSMLVKRTLICGAFFGVTMQWGLQRLGSALTGVPAYPELILVGAVVTGLASMAFYEVMRWYCKRKGWMDAYEFITVRHRSEHGHTGDTPNGDFTIYAAQGAEDPTDPRQ